MHTRRCSRSVGMPGKQIHDNKAFAESRLYKPRLYQLSKYNRLSANAITLLYAYRACPPYGRTYPATSFQTSCRMPYSGSEVLQHPLSHPLTSKTHQKVRKECGNSLSALFPHLIICIWPVLCILCRFFQIRLWAYFISRMEVTLHAGP